MGLTTTLLLETFQNCSDVGLKPYPYDNGYLAALVIRFHHYYWSHFTFLL